MRDVVLLEMLAACEQLAETTDRALRIVRVLAESYREPKPLNDRVLDAYTHQSESTASVTRPCRVQTNRSSMRFAVT